MSSDRLVNGAGVSPRQAGQSTVNNLLIRTAGGNALPLHHTSSGIFEILVPLWNQALNPAANSAAFLAYDRALSQAGFKTTIKRLKVKCE